MRTILIMLIGMMLCGVAQARPRRRAPERSQGGKDCVLAVTFNGEPGGVVTSMTAAVKDWGPYNTTVDASGYNTSISNEISIYSGSQRMRLETIDNHWTAAQLKVGSVSLWVKVDALGSRERFFAMNRPDDDNDHMINIFKNTSDEWRFYTDGATAGGTTTDITIAGVTAGVWHHLVATWDSTSAILYLNGAVGGTDTSPDYPTAWEDDRALLGSQGGSNPGNFTGCIDDVRIYRRKISQNEVKELYSEGKANGK